MISSGYYSHAFFHIALIISRLYQLIFGIVPRNMPSQDVARTDSGGDQHPNAVVEYARGIYPAEQDFIVMGDLNADGSYFDEDDTTTMRCEEYTWLITNDFDTTTKSTNATYDRIIITGGAGTDYAGEAGVFLFDTAYGLNQTMTEDVSDHYPVYAVFWTGRDRN